MAQLSTLRVARSEALVCLEAMCAQKLSEKHFHRLIEHLPEMVQNVKQALAQASAARFDGVDGDGCRTIVGLIPSLATVLGFIFFRRMRKVILWAGACVCRLRRFWTWHADRKLSRAGGSCDRGHLLWWWWWAV